jgi:hypothetical protein
VVPAIQWRRSWWAGVVACAAAAGQAAADPIVDRNFAIDFYDGVALGDTSQVGMGGAGAARLVGSAGTLLSPAAPAIRYTTDTDRWSWDYHFGALTGRFSSDYDNNGSVAEEASGASLLTGGLAFRYGNWGIAATATLQGTPLAGSTELFALTTRGKVAVARWFPRYQLSVGIGVQTVTFELQGDGPEAALFEIAGAGLLAGATWVPRMENFRAAIALETPIVGGDVSAQGCDPNNCQGYILPSEVTSPGRLIAGASYRWATTAWNQLVRRKFRDERSLTAAADLVVTGSSANGYGLEAFGMRELQRSGRSVGISLRGGAEFEWLPGRLRVRAGSYWEPGRFEGVGGRIHGTLGVDLRVFEFRAYGLRRGRISGTADVASRYRNLAVSIGLWR